MKYIFSLLFYLLAICTLHANDYFMNLSIEKVEGNMFNANQTLENRLCGLKTVQLVIPSDYRDTDDYVFGNFKAYLSQLGLNVIMTPSSAPKHTIIPNPYGGKNAIMLDYSDSDDVSFFTDEELLQTFNPFSITLCYIVSGNSISLQFQGVDLLTAQVFQKRFEIQGWNKDKFIYECRKNICFNRNFNPRYEYRPSYYKSNYSYADISTYFIINKNVSIYEGIYEDDNSKVAIIKDITGTYQVLYYNNDSSFWKAGDVKATLRQASNSELFLTNWYGKYKKTESAKVIFDEIGFSLIMPHETHQYIKTTPSTKNNSSPQHWTGTGFAIGGRFIVTNNHVIDEAKNISVIGIDGDFNYEYHANVIAVDKSNDLALIEIIDSDFNGFGRIPYRVKTNIANVGEDIFVLGYPLTSTMGDEIKLTTGVVSSKSGFQGDVSLYQISAPIQPGNSGGPLFDANGNVIGVICAKHNDADNVGYAVKSSYLLNLVESSINNFRLPSINQVSNLSRPQKIQKLKNFIFLIKCSQ